MTLFAKNKPTKTVSFGPEKEDYVILQHLSKGEKDTYTSRLAELSFSLKGITKETFENMDLDKLPPDMAKVVKEINELEYFKLARAIKSWSDKETPITEETVKELDDSIFAEIAKTIDEMNGLTDLERKN